MYLLSVISTQISNNTFDTPLSNQLIFCMNVGCGIGKSAAMDYGLKFNTKPVRGCGVIIEGTHAVFEPMSL